MRFVILAVMLIGFILFWGEGAAPSIVAAVVACVVVASLVFVKNVFAKSGWRLRNPIVLAGLLTTSCLIAKVVFPFALPYVVIDLPGVVVTWVLFELSPGRGGPSGVAFWGMLVPVYWAVNTLVWALVFAGLGLGWRLVTLMSRRQSVI